MNRFLVIVLVCAVSGVLGACGIVVVTSGKREATRGGACRSKGPCYGRESAASRAMVANWSGEACDEVLYSAKESHRQNSWSARRDADPRRQVLLASCARYKVRIDRSTGYPQMEEERAKVARLEIEATHASFDDRTFDHVQAALLVWSCAQTPLCYSAGKEKHYGGGVPTDRGAVLGIAGLYALHLDFDALESQLGAMDLPDGVPAAFLAIAHDATSKIVADIAELPDDVRPVFVEIPKLVYTERQAYFAEHESLYAELDALLERTRAARTASEAEPGLAQALLDLRSKYMAGCGQRACQLHPFYEEVTRELILVYAALNDEAAVRAEQETFRSEGQFVPGLAQTIYLRQQPLAVAGRDAFEKRKRARSEALDEATTTAILGGVPPVRYTHTSLVAPEMSWPDYAKVLGGKWSPPMSGYVASVKTKGDTATIKFKSTSHQVDVPYDCRRTKRLERIHRDGRLEYEQICKWKKRKETSPGPDAITVPAAEAKGLKKGDLVSAILGSGRRGWVRMVYRGDMIVQVRGDPVQPSPIPKRRK